MAYNEISSPGLDVFNRWHLHRQKVYHAAKLIFVTLEKTTSPVLYLVPATDQSYTSRTISEPPEYHLEKDLKQLQVKAAELTVSLKDLFDMLIGSIAVRDAHVSKAQARRANKLAEQAAMQTHESLRHSREAAMQTKQATTLTMLASFYLPLSLVTGIFGMNLKEINDSPPKWWVCVVALGLLAVPAVLALMKVRGDLRRRDAELDVERQSTVRGKQH
jgi:hypothetical protein